MEKQLFKPMALSLALVIALVQAIPSYCCGPFFSYAVFSYSNHPDLPLRKFAQGQLGIIQTSLAESYLVVAYRYLSNLSLDPAEQDAVLKLWHYRLTYNNDSVNTDQWRIIHNTVPGIKPLKEYEFNTYQYDEKTYSSHLNCSQSAVDTAVSTLKARIAKYGIGSPEVKFWVENQDRVFSNCGKTMAAAMVLPVEPGPNPDKLCQSDFAYQLAAANFYAENLDDAQTQFAAIAKDANSPWNKVAAYLEGRTAMRKYILGESKISASDPKTIEAAALLKRLLADKSLSDYQADLKGLDNYLQLRIHPIEESERLATAILSPHSGATLQHDLDDYTSRAQFIDSPSVPDAPESRSNQLGGVPLTADQDKFKKPLKEQFNNDLTEWLTCLSKKSNANTAHIIDQWQTRKTLPWLIAALIKVNSKDSIASELIDEAQRVPVNSPGYLSARYYSSQLLIKQNKKTEALKNIEPLFDSSRISVPPSSRNLLMAMRQHLARNLAESIYFGLKVPSAEVSDSTSLSLPDNFDKVELQNKFPPAMPATFDSGMAKALNEQLPLELWEELSHDKRLPPRIHNEVVAVSWMRAVLLGDNAMALRLTPLFQSSYPSIKTWLASFQSANSPSERRFVASYIMLMAPGLSPILRGELGRHESNIKTRDNYGDNFWTPDNPDKKPEEPQYHLYERINDDPAVMSPSMESFLTLAQKKIALKENRVLYNSSSPPRFITEALLDWSKVKPNDSRLPEALYRAVKMPKWGCSMPDSTKYSKAAYILLHSRYPSTVWAAKAQYYY
jgi:hypothetical protein